MSFTVEILESEVLSLPISERNRLIEKLILSIDTEPDVENSWIAEVERRHAEIENNSVLLLSGAETLARLQVEFQ